MGIIGDTLRALKTTLMNGFRRPTTVEFPDVIRPRAERYRASFALPNDENGELACIACLACERICPSHVIKMKSGGKRESPVTGKKRAYVDEFVLDLTACIQCELCVQVCNSDAIYMVREPEQPMFAREDLVLDLERLRANARDKTASWGRGTVLQEMQEVPKAAVEKKPAAAAKPTVETPNTTEPAAAQHNGAEPSGTTPAQAEQPLAMPAEPAMKVPAVSVTAATAPAASLEKATVKESA